MARGKLKQLAGALISAHGAAPHLVHFRSRIFWGTVLREVRMSQREEQSFKIVAGLVAVGALVIAAVMAMV